MARKRILVSSAGGIIAGVPFSAAPAGDILYVQQANPPVAGGSRLKQGLDAVQSLIAKGLSAATKTFVMGSNVAEGATQGSSILLGEDITPVTGGGVADKQILIGVGIAQLAAFQSVDRTILLGNNPTFSNATGLFGNSVLIGHNLVTNATGGSADTVGSVLIGNGATVQGGTSVTIGAAAIGDDECVTLGQAATTNGAAQSVAVGKIADARGNRAIAIGQRARAQGAQSIAIGFFADALLDDQIAMGRDATGGAFTAAAVFGRGTVVFENNAWAFGGDPTNGTEMQVLRLGPNTLAGYPGLSVFLPSAAAGNNVDAPNTLFRAGISTGNAVAKGRIIFQSSTKGAAGVTYQAIVDRFRVAPGGVAGIPTIEFVNQISTPGVQAGTLLNAPVAGNPAIWAEVLYNGALHYIPMW